MCDERTLEDWAKYLKDAPPVSRRRFAALTAGASLAAALPQFANAQRLSTGMVEVNTPDGVADCYMAHLPNGSYPGVIVWPDVLGLRPAFIEMANRLAGSGYAVLVANPYYRNARAPVIPDGASFADQAVRDKVFPLAGALNAETHITDAKAFVEYLDAHGAVARSRKLATMGYCMGGPMALRTASARPDRVGAAASFHGGRLATDDADSPHRAIPSMHAQFLIAVAENDDKSDPAAKSTLRESFAAAGLVAEIEVYRAQHGWCVPDATSYDDAEAERAWGQLLALLKRSLAA